VNAPRARALLCALSLAGCVANGPLAPPALDLAVFSSRAQPVLAARCATPACHGSDRRRLRVYAPGFFRSDPARVHRDEPLSSDELLANERSASAFAADVLRADESLLVTRPLGYGGHLGGRVLSESDADTAALLAWLRTGGLP
jgi:hypothetical protein